MAEQQFKDKVVLVTGAASGIGRASALAFAREGGRIVVSDVAEDGARETVAAAQKLGAEAVFFKCDISHADEVSALISKTVERFGRLDCAHNNAGVEGRRAYTADCSEEDWDFIMSINLRGTWLCLKYEIAQMLQNGGGAIVNTASVASMVALGGGMSAYTVSKHGLLGLTRVAAVEYAKKGIRINAVCPGPIETPMLAAALKSDPRMQPTILALEPQGRFGQPEEVSAAVLWLCSNSASFVTGTSLVVDGGWTAQ